MTFDNPLKQKPFWMAASLIFAAGVVLYLPLSHQLGFYFNDWHPLASWLTDINLVRLFRIDRPTLGVLYTVTHSILGNHPLAWQLFTFLGRVIGAWLFLWLVNLLWPRRWGATTAMGLIFIIYPGFLQQPIALTFSNHFIGYAAGIFSLGLTIQALLVDSRRVRWFSVGFALFFQFIYLFIYEYMIGLEALRFILVLYVLYQRKGLKSKRDFFISAVRSWAPYVFIVGLFLVWRIFIFSSSRSTTDVGLIASNYLSQPVQMFARLFVETFRDFVETLILAWAVPLYQVWFNASHVNLLISLVLGAVLIAMSIAFYRWLHNRYRQDEFKEDTEAAGKRYLMDAIWIGVFATLFLIFPVVLSNREVQYRLLLDRYTLHTTIGVAMLMGALIYYLFRNPVRQWVLIGLILISSMTLFNNAFLYKKTWDYQQQLWWQLSWRAPQIEPETVLMFLLPQGHRMMEDEEIYVPANLIYYPTPGPLTLVSEVLEPYTALQVQRGEIGYRNYRYIEFQRDFSKALIGSIPNESSCLHIYDRNQIEATLSEDPVVRSVTGYSNADRIIASANSGKVPQEIFGREPEHGWCYYYQKASLARQAGDWAAIVSLSDEVREKGLVASNPVEWLPFYEAYVNVGQQDAGQDILAIIRSDSLALRSMCLGLESSPGAYSSVQTYRQMVNAICGQD